MDLRQTVYITLAGEPPKIIDGYWHEWVNGEWVNTGIKAEAKDGSNFLIMGFFSDKIQYRLSPAGIPVVKHPDSTQGGFSVHKLTAMQSSFNNSTKKGTFVPSEWELVENVDFIYMQEAYIEHLQALTVTAKKVRTSESGARTEIDSEGIKVFNALDTMNIRFGLKNGYAVMEYYDNDNNLLYDLGPGGISKVEVREEKWVEVKLVYLGAFFSNVLTDYQIMTKYKTPGLQNETTFYRYVSKVVAGQNQDTINDGKIFKNSNKASGYITAGVYMQKTVGMQMEMLTENTGTRIYPPGIQPENEGVFDRSPLYFVRLLHYTGGAILTTANAYWNPGLSPI